MGVGALEVCKNRIKFRVWEVKRLMGYKHHQNGVKPANCHDKEANII